MLFHIVNQSSLYVSVSGLQDILKSRCCGQLSNILLIAGLVVTGYQPHLQTAWGFYSTLLLILVKWTPTIFDIFPKFSQFGRIRPGGPNRVTRSSYSAKYRYFSRLVNQRNTVIVLFAQSYKSVIVLLFCLVPVSLLSGTNRDGKHR
jgi:hypothetical protein